MQGCERNGSYRLNAECVGAGFGRILLRALNTGKVTPAEAAALRSPKASLLFLWGLQDFRVLPPTGSFPLCQPVRNWTG